MKNVNWTVVLLIAIIGFLGYDKFVKSTPEKADDEIVTHDPAVQKLGAQYKAKFVAIGSMPFNAVANGDFENLGDLTKAQQKSLDKALEDAYTPIAIALEQKFGKAEDAKNTASVDTVKAFFKDLALGYKAAK